ncbi:two-component system sensor histidine kinase CreC [Pseudoduganella sp. RAF19]|uniref:two-component system sensor histidine kinase CreC n=1 Tax=Pseudoduganella sp. RAF19 TaxID=3233052 RepID=UPI003F975D14
MKIGLRILLGYFLIVGLAAWFLLNVFVEEVKPGVRSTLEDTLRETAQLLAEVVAADLRDGNSEASLQATMGGVARRELDYRITITDAQGIVRFDSENKHVGQDYSQWNDIYRTLRGQYGARMTRDDPADERSVVMYVAAPVRDGQRLIGVLTVAKPISSVQAIVERSQRRMLRYGAVLLGLSLLIGAAVTWRMAYRVGKLMDYVEAVLAGRKAVLPTLGSSEISTLGRAMDAMRAKLEGKEYVETLMHTLAHELKSPIAAIQASAELLEEDMSVEERRHFLANIQGQNARQRQLIDKLLALVRVEKQQGLEAAEVVDVTALLQDVAGDFRARAAERELTLDTTAAGQLRVHGDPLLLRQAIGNLLDNAISFAPPHSVVCMAAQRRDAAVDITVSDSGAGVPDYAEQRIFERFYSLPRPDGAKSTGLGLPFVREVAALHGGSVQVANAEQGGCRATLRLPAQPVS